MATAGLKGNHIYDHLGVRSTRIDDESAETHMPISDDIRTSGGLRAAALGLAFEQGVATYMFDRVMAVPSQISLHVRDRGEGVKGIRSETHIIRWGRSLVTNDGQIRDADDPSRLLAYGSITWAVIGEAPDRSGGGGHTPPAYEEAGVDIMESASITALADGSGCRVEGITPQTTGPGGILHAGMFQLLSEEAALVAAKTATGASKLMAVDCTYNFLQPGKTGPFIATAEVICVGDEGVDTKVTVRDEGNNDRVPAVSFVRVRPIS
ncbi:MAG: hypothetical protein JF603_12590 [Acidobacteria bacterium]|nr:hypothetical protein [Acidobacteriota bacterium]